MADQLDSGTFIAPTFGQRVGGRLLDTLIVLPVFLLAALISNGSPARVIAFALAAAYEIIAVAVWGQTLGKRIVGTRVVSAVSPQLRPQQAVVRFLVYGGFGSALTALGAHLVAELVTFVVVLPAIRPPLHRGLHDLAARTIVIPTRTWSSSPPP